MRIKNRLVKKFRWNAIMNLILIFILVIIAFALFVFSIILFINFQQCCCSHHVMTFDTKESQYLFENEANSDWFPDGTVGDNIRGYPYFIVPNIVHYLVLDKTELMFVHYISIKSVLRHQKPDRIYIHCNCDKLDGKYWTRLENELNYIDSKKIIFLRIEKPLTVFGLYYSKEWHNWHVSDVLRNKILLELGGIYLDNDVYVVKSLDPLRKFEMTLDFEKEKGFMGSQIQIAHKRARFLRLFLQTYQKYDPNKWYWNAGEYPTEIIIKRFPHLVHRMNGEFGVDGREMCPILYKQNVNYWQKNYFTIHLLMRNDNIEHHYKWCFKHKPEDYPSIRYFDEENVKTLNTTFAQMVRLVLYNTTDFIV